MRLFAPRYYLDFKCIADKCENSCCVVWEIDVDEIYKNLESNKYSVYLNDNDDTDGGAD